MVFNVLYHERGLAWRKGVVRLAQKRHPKGLHGPTEREPRTAIFRFLSSSPGMLVGGGREGMGSGRGYYKGVPGIIWCGWSRMKKGGNE